MQFYLIFHASTIVIKPEAQYSRHLICILTHTLRHLHQKNYGALVVIV
jgi:hypothetical protein